MLSRPPGLPDEVLVAELARSWQVAAGPLTYRPVGFGSHHWEFTDAAGTRWFLTADELENKRHAAGETLDTAFARLRASLAAATDLRRLGCAFVLAPVPARDGEPVVRAAGRFGVALYPFADGQSFGWGDFTAPGHRQAVLRLVIALHTAPAAAARQAMPDDFAIPHRDELEAALDPVATVADCGPYARAASRLMTRSSAPVRRLLARYDELAARGRARLPAAVLTHGEPHPGNTMLTPAGWLLIDWDTALLAPPERDLWSLDPGDGSVLSAYRDATGVTPLPWMLELYRIRWDLADVAIDVGRFRRPHSGSADDEKTWQVLRELIGRLSA